jgi:hypothetical protein
MLALASGLALANTGSAYANGVVYQPSEPVVKIGCSGYSAAAYGFKVGACIYRGTTYGDYFAFGHIIGAPAGTTDVRLDVSEVVVCSGSYTGGSGVETTIAPQGATDVQMYAGTGLNFYGSCHYTAYASFTESGRTVGAESWTY